ncbi:MAG: M50 family metallopeptidase [Pseudonocardiaceae bacterium]
MPKTPRDITGLLLAVLVLVVLLAGCAVDADGDGYDDNTGKPIAVSIWESDDSSASGCGAGGVEWLCGDPDPEVDPEGMATVARHEAGHVAAARALGGSVGTVRLYPDGTGRTYAYGLPADPQSQVTFLVAGEIAAGTAQGAEGDHAEIDKVLSGLAPAEWDRIESAARTQATRIVAERADEIDRDAARLLKHRWL